MTPLQQLETEFHFSYPGLYHRLYADGMLNWGQFGPGWMEDWYSRLRAVPPLLLFANDFELMTMKAIKSQAEEFNSPDYWMSISPGLVFIPFAQTGAGDFYCFYLNGQQAEDIPIVLLWHDADRAEYKAKNLQDFIFRCMLEAVADIEEAAYGLLQEANFTTDLQSWLDTHCPYLTSQQSGIIRDIYTTTASRKPLLSAEQLQVILGRELHFAHQDQSFKYRTA